MQLPSKRAVVLSMLIGGVLITGTPFIGTTAAQCDTSSPGAMSECEDPSLNPFEGMMENIYDLLYGSMLYLGFIGVFGGSTMYLMTESNSDRAQNGLWIFMGGMGLILGYFAINVLVKVLRYLAVGF